MAGALLLTPGFVTDFVGFLLLAPPSRARIVAYLLSRVVVMDARAPSRVIEGEFEPLDREKDPRGP